MKKLLLIDKLGKNDLQKLLSEGSVSCGDQVITLEDLQEEGRFKEPYRTALVLKILGKTTGALLCALSLIDCEHGTYGRRIGQELKKDDNYIRQLLNILEEIDILDSSEGKGKQRIFTLREDLLLLPKGQLPQLMQGKPISTELLMSRELENQNIHLEDLLHCVFDERINQIIHPGAEREKFEVGQLIESMVKCGIVRTFETSSSKRLHHQEFLTFYELLTLLEMVVQKVPQDRDSNIRSSDLTRIIEEELQKRDETGEIARKYRDYVHYGKRKQIVTDEGPVSIDFSTLKERIKTTAEQKGIKLSSKMKNLLAEDVITSLKGLPMRSFTHSFIEMLIDNLLEDRFLITSSEERMKKVETLMRVGNRLLESARDYQHLDAAKATEYSAEASLNFLSLLLLLYGEVPSQKLLLMSKAFMKKKGDQSIFTIVVEDFSSARKMKKIKEMEEFSRAKQFLEEKVHAFDVARFLKMYLKMVESYSQEDFVLEEFIEATEVIALLGRLLFAHKMQME